MEQNEIKKIIELKKERVRVTKKLAKMVTRISEIIVDSVEDGTTIQIKNRRYKVFSMYGQGGQFRFLGVTTCEGVTCEEADYAVTYWYRIFDEDLNQHFHFEGNVANKMLHTVTREDVLYFINHLDEVLRSFSQNQERIISRMKKALGDLYLDINEVKKRKKNKMK